MNKTSSIATGGVTVSAAALEPYVQWLIDGRHGPIPTGSALLISAAIITLAHALYNLLSTRKTGKDTTAPPTPPAQ
jgi:hypothetical protein